jgi:hypothetical protein
MRKFKSGAFSRGGCLNIHLRKVSRAHLSFPSSSCGRAGARRAARRARATHAGVRRGLRRVTAIDARRPARWGGRFTPKQRAARPCECLPDTISHPLSHPSSRWLRSRADVRQRRQRVRVCLAARVPIAAAPPPPPRRRATQPRTALTHPPQLLCLHVPIIAEAREAREARAARAARAARPRPPRRRRSRARRARDSRCVCSSEQQACLKALARSIVANSPLLRAPLSRISSRSAASTAT